MWHLSLHRRRGHYAPLFVPAHARWWNSLRARLGLMRTHPAERLYRIIGLSLPLIPLELDLWRPLRPDEIERQRNPPIEGEIVPLTDEERARRLGHT